VSRKSVPKPKKPKSAKRVDIWLDGMQVDVLSAAGKRIGLSASDVLKVMLYVQAEAEIQARRK
jgi:negative regulator of replication initiation